MTEKQPDELIELGSEAIQLKLRDGFEISLQSKSYDVTQLCELILQMHKKLNSNKNKTPDYTK